MTKTIAQMATIAGRNSSRVASIRSLIGQVDELHLIYNGGVFFENNEHMSRKFPPIIQHYPKGAADIQSDGWKFFGVEKHEDAYILICDDDILYPEDFAARMITKVEEYGRKAVITCMGKILKPRPIRSFYLDEEACFRTFADNPSDALVEIPGTCAMAFHSSAVKGLTREFFQSMNSDIWMGVFCKQNNIHMIVMEKSGSWLKDFTAMNPSGVYNVFDAHKENDAEMTEVVNRYL